MQLLTQDKMDTKIPPQQPFDGQISDHNPVFEKGGNLQCRGEGSVDFEFMSFGALQPTIATGGRQVRITLGFSMSTIIQTLPTLLMFQTGAVTSGTLQVARGYAANSSAITLSRRPDILAIAPYSRPLSGTLPNALHLPGVQVKMIPHTYQGEASGNSSSNHNMMWVNECTNNDPQYTLATYVGGTATTGATAVSNAPIPLDDDTTRNPTFWHMFLVQRTLFADAEDDYTRFFPYLIKVRFRASGLKFSPLVSVSLPTPKRFAENGDLYAKPLPVSYHHECGHDEGEPSTKKTRKEVAQRAESVDFDMCTMCS